VVPDETSLIRVEKPSIGVAANVLADDVDIATGAVQAAPGFEPTFEGCTRQAFKIQIGTIRYSDALTDSAKTEALPNLAISKTGSIEKCSIIAVLNVIGMPIT